MMEERVELVTVLDEVGLFDVTILDGGTLDVSIEALAQDEAIITILHELPGAMALEGLKGGSGLDAEASVDLAGWYNLQKEL